MKLVLPCAQILAKDCDVSLLSKIALGEQDAIAALYDRYSSLVYTAALDVLGHREEAEDIVCDIFLQVWRSPTLFLAYRELLGLGLASRSRKQARLAKELRSVIISAVPGLQS